MYYLVKRVSDGIGVEEIRGKIIDVKKIEDGERFLIVSLQSSVQVIANGEYLTIDIEKSEDSEFEVWLDGIFPSGDDEMYLGALKQTSLTALTVRKQDPEKHSLYSPLWIFGEKVAIYIEWHDTQPEAENINMLLLQNS